MPVDGRMRAQNQLILDNHEGAAAHPAADRWDEVDDIDYLYREYAILARQPDADRVAEALGAILGEVGYGDIPEGDAREIVREPVSSGLVRLTVPGVPTLVPDLVGRLDDALGRGVARPEHKIYVCPFTCPATEPVEVPPGTAAPVPPLGLDIGGRRIPWTGNDGDGVTVSIVDTGLIHEVAAAHPWLAGVEGTEENTYADVAGEQVIVPYAGHGTFVAGVLRSVAPRASVFVERAFDIAGADFETRLASSLDNALDRNPDILVFTFTSATHRDQSLHTFDDFYERRIRQAKGLVVLAPAGNDGSSRPMWPAAHPGVIAVGALAANGRRRAHFSNHGRWVDVYAPGEDLVNAFPAGTYVCAEPPNVGERRQFHGMARWSGTSFSTPVVAGLIAARMSQSGENAQQAADALLRFACGQAIPGVGPVLYPGQSGA
jgi:subtilisin family serine protease